MFEENGFHYDFWQEVIHKEDEQNIEEFKKTLSYDPKNLSVRYSLGCAYLRLKKINEAIKEFKQVITSAPNSPEAKMAKGLMLEIEKQSPVKSPDKVEEGVTDVSTCYYHPEKKALFSCSMCGKPLCQACLSFIKGKYYCSSCLK